MYSCCLSGGICNEISSINMTGRLLSTLLDSLIVHSAYSNHPSRLRYTSVRQVRWEEGISRQASIWVVASGWSHRGGQSLATRPSEDQALIALFRTSVKEATPSPIYHSEQVFPLAANWVKVSFEKEAPSAKPGCEIIRGSWETMTFSP